MRSGRSLSVFVVLLAFALAGAMDESDRAGETTIDSMSIKQLRAALRERGVSCDGCSEKSEFRERLRSVWGDAQHRGNAAVEDLEMKKSPADQIHSADAKVDAKPMREDQLDPDLLDQLRSAARKKKQEKDDLKSKLRKAGINAEMFDGNDLEGILSGLGDRKKAKRKPPPPRRNPKQRETPFPTATHASRAAPSDDDEITDEL